MERFKRHMPHDDPFRSSDVRMLFGAQGVSSLGTQVSNIAFPLIAIDVIQASNGSIALMQGAFMVPFVLFGLPVGAIVDRRARRPVLIAMDLVRMGALLFVPAAALAGVLQMPVLLFVLFVMGTCSLMYDVAHQSFLPSLLRGGGLATANSRLITMEAGTGVVGPSIAGLAVARLGGPLALIVDSLSYLISALMLRRVQHLEVTPDDEAPRSIALSRIQGMRRALDSLRNEVREGLSWVIGNPHLRGNAAAALLFNFFGGIASAPLLIAYARRELALPPELIGLILGAGIIGLVVGSSAAGAIATRFGVGRTIIAGGFILPILPLGFALIDVSMGPLLVTVLAIAVQIVAFFGAALFHVNQVTYRQLVTPDRLLGRMNASMKWLMLLGLPLGTIVGSVVADSAGLRAALFVGSIGVLVAPLPLLVSGISAVERQPERVRT